MEIKRAYIYRYKENNETPLCIYLCNTQAKNKILIVPLTSESTQNTYKLSVTSQYADMASYKEIERDTIISPLFLKSKPVKISEKDLKNIYDFILSDLLSNISSTARNGASTLLIFESIYQFIKWKQKKLLLNISPYQRKTHVYENGVYWASLGVNVGSELNKNRPVLIWKKRCNGKEEKDFSYIVIPITSKSKSRNYYMNVPIVINSRQCYLRIEDMRRINIRRISRPILDEQKNIIFIDEEKRKEIMDSLERFYIFENRHKKI